MRVAVVSHSCVLEVNRAVYRQLEQDGLDVHLIVPKRFETDGRVIELEPEPSGGPALVPLDLKGTQPRTYRMPRLRAALSEIQPDVVHLDNDPLSVMAIEAGIWCRAHRSALSCLTCENLDFGFRDTMGRRGGARGAVLAAMKVGLMAASRPRVSHVFAISSDGVQIFRQHKFRSVSLTPLGFDPDLFRPDEGVRREVRQRLGFDGPIVAYVGRLTPEKGVHLLVEALARVNDLDWRFMLDRFSPLASDYSRQIEAALNDTGVRDRTIHIEATHGEIGRYMAAADVMVLPSLSTPWWREQYGRVAPEAMACGALVVVARSGALPELVGDAGLLFEEGSVDELAATLRTVLSDLDSFSGLRKQAVARAHDGYTVERQAQEFRKVFDRLVQPTD